MDNWKEESGKTEAYCNAIVLAFDNQFHYDYDIPRLSLITNRLRDVLPNLNICDSLRTKIESVLQETYDTYSSFHDYFKSQHRFRTEWFYGWGDLYTWRPGERDKANRSLQRFFTEVELNDLMTKLWPVLAITQKNYPDRRTFWEKTISVI